MEFGIFTGVVGVIGAFVGIYFNSFNSSRGEKQRNIEMGREQGEINTKLDMSLRMLQKNNDDITDNKNEIAKTNLKQVVFEERIDNLDKRVTSIESKMQ